MKVKFGAFYDTTCELLIAFPGGERTTRFQLRFDHSPDAKQAHNLAHARADSHSRSLSGNGAGHGGAGFLGNHMLYKKQSDNQTAKQLFFEQIDASGGMVSVASAEAAAALATELEENGYFVEI